MTAEGTVTDDAEDIRRITREVTDGFNSGDVERMMRHYAESYIDVNQPEPRQSWAERRDYYARIIGDGRTSIEVTPRQIEVSGERAFVWGDLAVLIPGEDGATNRRELRYLEIWRRTPDGWKAIWGMDCALQA